MKDRAYGIALLHDAAQGLVRGAAADWVVDEGIRPVWPSGPVAGPAYTIRISLSGTPVEGEESVPAAYKQAPEGHMVVVRVSVASRLAVLGDIVSTILSVNGAVGAVVDGLVRDSDDLTASRFAVWTRGYAAGAIDTRFAKAESNVDIVLGGVLVRSGDLVVGDSDGVIVVPAEMSALVLAGVEKLVVEEAEFKAAVRLGTDSMSDGSGVSSS